MFDVQFITHFTASISYPDSARIALEGGCRWVQLRMKDVSEEELKNTAMQARKMLGKGFIIGGTANTFADIRQHVADGADYIGCGPFRFTTTKQKLSPILGLDGYRSILVQMQEEGLTIPIVAIGGITREDIPSLKALGLSGIALSGGILKAENPVLEMETIIRLTQ